MKIIHICSAVADEVKRDHRSKFSNLSRIGKKKREKNQGFNGIRTRDVLDAGAMIYLHLQPQYKYELFSYILHITSLHGKI